MPLSPVGVGSSAGAPVGHEVDVGLDPLLRRSCRGRGSGAGPTGWSVGIVMWTGVPSPICWPRCVGGVGVERGGEEDRAARRRRSRGPRARRAGGGSRGPWPTRRCPSRRPCRTVMSSASILTFISSSAPAAAGRARRRRSAARCGRVRLADQPLERPVAALHDARRDAGQRRDRAERAATARELEGGDVVLHAVVVAGEGRRPEQVHRAVGADEPAARERRVPR